MSEKKRTTVYISEDTEEKLREMSYFQRKTQSSLVEEAIAELYRRWKLEAEKDTPRTRRRAKA